MNIAFTKGLADDPKRYIFNSYLRLMGERWTAKRLEIYSSGA